MHRFVLCIRTDIMPSCEHTMVAVAPHYLYVIGGQTTASPQVNVVDTAHLADVQVFDLAALR